jgi:hypothetical protein
MTGLLPERRTEEGDGTGGIATLSHDHLGGIECLQRF